MRKLLITHYLYTTIFVLFLSLVKRYFSLSYYPLWIGAAVGAILPDIDHLIYIYLLRPHELSSQRATQMIQKKNFWQAMDFLALTRSERKGLIFHNSMFQMLFVIFSYLVVTSTVNLFGKGLVLAFLLHLAIDQVIDLVKLGNINHWFDRFKFTLNKQQETLYWIANLVIFFILALF